MKASFLSLRNGIKYIIPLYIFLIVMKYLVGETSGMSSLITALFVFLGWFSLIVSISFIKGNSIIWLFVITLMIFSGIVFPFSGNYRVVDFFLMLNYLGIALLTLYCPLNYKLYKTIAYFTLGIFVTIIFLGFSPDTIFSASRNFISVLLLLINSFYIISCKQNSKNPSPIILILSLFVTVWAGGRSGIFVFAILLTILPIVSKYKLIYKVIILGVIFLLAIYIYNSFADTLFSTASYRIEHLGVEDVRSEMNAEYLEKTINSAEYLFFGTPLTNLETLRIVDYNPHNSYIRLHIFYGLLGFCFVSILILLSFFKYFKKRNFLFFVLLFAVAFRSSVDSTSFHGPLDPIFFFLIFNPFKNIHLHK